MKIGLRKKKQKEQSNLTKVPTLTSGISDAIDVMSPDGLFFPDWQELLEKKRGYIQTGGRRFTRVFQIKQHPAQVHLGYLNEFYSIGDVDISCHVYPGDPDEDVTELTDMIIKLETALYTKDGKHAANDAVVEASLEDTKILRDKISLNRDRMFYVSVFIAVSAESMEELDKKSEEVERLAGQKLMRIAETFLEEDFGYQAAAPLGVNPIEDNHSNFDLGATVSLFPFDSPELTHPNGTFLGLNYYTGAPIFFNNFGKDLPATHMNIVGRTRSGKSTLVKILILRDAPRGIQTWVFDPEGEYGPTIRLIGGHEVIFRPGVFCGINFCDIYVDELENSNHLLSKIEEVKNVLLFFMENDGQHPITPEEEALLEEAIREEYARLGITDNPDSLWEQDARAGAVGLVKKQSPDISSICDRLAEKGDLAMRMLTRMIPYKRGGTMGMFDGQTEFDLSEFPAVSFNLSPLDSMPKLKPKAMNILQIFTWELFVKRNLHIPKRVVEDEAWLFTKWKNCLEFQEQLARRAGKRNCTLTLSTQNYVEFTRSDEGRVVLSQAGVTLFFRQNANDLKAIQELWDMPDGQVDFIRSLDQGECLIRIGEQVTAMKVEVMPIEEPHVYTTAGQWGVVQKEMESNREGVDEEAEVFS